MKLIYAGTPDFAAVALRALVEAGHDVLLVLTQPDRPSGRGLRLTPSPVKQVAAGYGLPVEQPSSLKNPEVAARLARLEADAMVVAAYGLILPSAVLAAPRLGCLNIHASVLPRWRGAAPIQRAILAGDPESGISIMQMDEGLDTGPVLLQQAIPIAPDDTAQTLHDKLARLGAELIVRALAHLPEPSAQDDSVATYAAKIDKREAALDWREDSDVLQRKVRAFNPVPGAVTRWEGQPLKIWTAKPEPAVRGDAGVVIEAGAHGIVVACGQGGLRITELQKAGGRRLGAAAFVAGNPSMGGARLGD